MKNILKIIIIMIGFYFGGTGAAWGQLVFGTSSDTEIRPHAWVRWQNVDVQKADIADGSNDAIGESTVQMSDEFAALQLMFANFYRRTKRLTYDDSASWATALNTASAEALTETTEDATETSVEALTLAEGDFPEILYSERWKGELPTRISENSVLILYGGASIHSDKKDVSNEDYNSYMAFSIWSELSDGDSWSVGAVQASYLGRIGDIMPVGEYTSRFSGGALSAGLIYTSNPLQHLSENLSEPIVYPFFALQLDTSMPLELELVIPVKASLFALIAETWSLEISATLTEDAYRLTKKDPWQSRIMSFSSIQSVFAIGYYFRMVHLYAGIGTQTNQSIHFFEEDQSHLATFRAADADRSYAGIEFVF